VKLPYYPCLLLLPPPLELKSTIPRIWVFFNTNYTHRSSTQCQFITRMHTITQKPTECRDFINNKILNLSLLKQLQTTLMAVTNFNSLASFVFPCNPSLPPDRSEQTRCEVAVTVVDFIPKNMCLMRRRSATTEVEEAAGDGGARRVWCEGPKHCFRVQVHNSFWRWQVYWFWFDLWLCWECKGIWTKIRLVRNKLDTKVEKSRKQMKERKNRAKKIRGVKKRKAGDDQFCSAFNYNFCGNFESSL